MTIDYFFAIILIFIIFRERLIPTNYSYLLMKENIQNKLFTVFLITCLYYSNNLLGILLLIIYFIKFIFIKNKISLSNEKFKNIKRKKSQLDENLDEIDQFGLRDRFSKLHKTLHLAIEESKKKKNLFIH